MGLADPPAIGTITNLCRTGDLGVAATGARDPVADVAADCQHGRLQQPRGGPPPLPDDLARAGVRADGMDGGRACLPQPQPLCHRRAVRTDTVGAAPGVDAGVAAAGRAGTGLARLHHPAQLPRQSRGVDPRHRHTGGHRAAAADWPVPAVRGGVAVPLRQWQHPAGCRSAEHRLPAGWRTDRHRARQTQRGNRARTGSQRRPARLLLARTAAAAGAGANRAVPFPLPDATDAQQPAATEQLVRRRAQRVLDLQSRRHVVCRTQPAEWLGQGPIRRARRGRRHAVQRRTCGDQQRRRSDPGHAFRAGPGCAVTNPAPDSSRGRTIHLGSAAGIWPIAAADQPALDRAARRRAGGGDHQAAASGLGGRIATRPAASGLRHDGGTHGRLAGVVRV